MTRADRVRTAALKAFKRLGHAGWITEACIDAIAAGIEAALGAEETMPGQAYPCSTCGRKRVSTCERSDGKLRCFDCHYEPTEGGATPEPSEADHEAANLYVDAYEDDIATFTRVEVARRFARVRAEGRLEGINLRAEIHESALEAARAKGDAAGYERGRAAGLEEVAQRLSESANVVVRGYAEYIRALGAKGAKT